MIREGDTVKVWRVMEESNSLCPPYDAEVLNMPRGEGDLIQLKLNDGSIEAINPYSKFFDSTTKANP